VWADDFHHQVRRSLAGDTEGYFAEFDGSVKSIAETAKRGWLRGSDPTGVQYSKFVYCIQNHDQIGNRALGDRLNHCLDRATYRAASALLLLLPETPLLFMGQEWAATAPFQYFTDHSPELGALVIEGRRREFTDFSEFSNAAIPDPQAFETFNASRLNWDEPAMEPHAAVLRLYKDLLRMRRLEPALGGIAASPKLMIEASGDATLLLRRKSSDPMAGLLAVIRLHGSGEVNLSGHAFVPSPMFTSEDPMFASDSQPIQVQIDQSRITFQRPGAIVFRSVQTEVL
jgi:maltooligosyltrehalose trehalohydrolase